jgi:hypothetical protein
VQRLSYLARNYFHQDWDLEAPTPVGVVEVFRDEEPARVVAELRTELIDVLAAQPTEDALRTLWLRTSGSMWDPSSSGWGSYRAWFEAMLETVS